MNDIGRHPRELSTTQVIALGFFAAIAIGTMLLMLPFSSADGQPASLVTALFTATTSVCVTGLVVVPTVSSWSLFGHIVIMLLIQLGGLGIVAFTTSILLLLNRRVTLRDRLLLEDAFNLNTLSGLVAFLRKVLRLTIVIESIGLLCYLPCFVPRFGWRGVWISAFTAVSAFCNAGIDIFAQDSLMSCVGDVWLNLVTMALIVAGGIGFIVWSDIGSVFRRIRCGELRRGRVFSALSLHSKLALTVTGLLIIIGWLLILALEYHNPDTLGSMSFGGKLLASLFQSVTCRTAGFAAISQSALRDSTAVVCMILFFIGGSSVGTAGGVKTTSIALVVLFAVSTARASRDAAVFRRTIPTALLRKALAVVTISLATALTATITLSAVTGGDFIDVAFETFSAIGTVGLSRDFTATMNTAGRLIIILCMYLGRIGPITMAIAFGRKRGSNGLATYPNEEVTVG